MTPNEAAPLPLPIDALMPGAVLVHRTTGYVFRLDSAAEAGAISLRFTGVGQYRFLELSREEALLQLRLPIDVARAEQLERLIVHEASVLADPDLDLMLYMRGTPEQVAAAIATLIDRIVEGPERLASIAASDLRFAQLKLLGELAWVKQRAADLLGRAQSRDLPAYEAELRTQRGAVLHRDRLSTVAAPHVPVVPNTVVTAARVNQDGWHVLETRLASGMDLVAASLGYWTLDVHEELGTAGELFVSSMHSEGGIQWIVLSEHAPATVVVIDGTVHATTADETIFLTRRPTRPGQVLVVARKDTPADLLASIDVRLNYPQAQLLVWTFGLATAPGMDGWTAYVGRSARSRVMAFACG